MNTNSLFIKFVAKRKFWIEWHCLFEKHPLKRNLEAAEIYLRDYVRKYLEEYFRRRKDGKEYPALKPIRKEDIPKLISGDVYGVFGEGGLDPHPTEKGVAPQSAALLMEYFIFTETGSWTSISLDDYLKAVKDNESPNTPPEKKTKLKYALYPDHAEIWMRLLTIEWKEVSGSHNVFSFQGWFEGKNNLRLTDAGAENRGSMNPPPPPPPPP